MSAAVTTPLLALGKKMVGVASSFESQANIMALAARNDGVALDTLKQAAVAVGGDIRLVGIDAMEAASAMTNFYKAGLDTSQIMGDLNAYLNDGAELGGALRAAIDMAAASELDLARSSDVVAIAMATFGLDASEASRVTDAFVRAADASITSVGELADALANVGPTLATFGWSIEDSNLALAILSQRGIRGAEAGTALKSMMTNMMRPTDKVTAALDALNVTLYNEAGEMRDLPDIIAQFSKALDLEAVRTYKVSKLTEKQGDELVDLEEKYNATLEKIEQYKSGLRGTTETDKQRAKSIAKLEEQLRLYELEMEPLVKLSQEYTTVTGRMTEKQRNQYIQTLAGTYGMKAMNTLMAEGIEGWEEMESKVGMAATTQEAAGARTKGFAAAMENLQGVIQTFMIVAGGPLIENYLTPAVKRITEFADRVVDADPKIIALGLGIAGAAAAAGPMLLVLGGITTALGALLSPVGLAAGALLILAAKFVKTQGGIEGATKALSDWYNGLEDKSVGGIGKALLDELAATAKEIPYRLLGWITELNVWAKSEEARDKIKGAGLSVGRALGDGLRNWLIGDQQKEETGTNLVDMILSSMARAWERIQALASDFGRGIGEGIHIGLAQFSIVDWLGERIREDIGKAGGWWEWLKSQVQWTNPTAQSGGILGGLLNPPTYGPEAPAYGPATPPGNANGTSNWGGGWSLVGERGPELVNLPRGSQVLDANETKAAMGTTVNIAEGAIVIHVNNGNAREVQRGVVGALRQIGMPA